MVVYLCFVCLFKQKTAYEMRIRDWSSDVCSSDLILPEHDIRPYSVPQLAERWGCSDSMIRKLINEGELQSFRIGVLIRISAAEVEKIGRASCRERVCQYV